MRLPTYLALLRDLQKNQEMWISSVIISQTLGVSGITVRKDLAATGIRGRPKKGFPTKELADRIESVLHWNTERKAIVIGTGNLGQALLNYTGFGVANLNVIAGFDLSIPHGSLRPVYTMDALSSFLAKHNDIETALLCVPGKEAQLTALDLIKTKKIKNIWNFTPVILDLPNNINVQNSNMLSTFALLSTAEEY